MFRRSAAVAANPNLYQTTDSTVPNSGPGNAARGSPATNLVHESEIQRQYVRAKVPGVLEVGVGQGKAQRFQLYDLSGGGLAFEGQSHAFRAGDRYAGRIHLKLETISVAVPVEFDVRSVDPILLRRQLKGYLKKPIQIHWILNW